MAGEVGYVGIIMQENTYIGEIRPKVVPSFVQKSKKAFTI